MQFTLDNIRNVVILLKLKIDLVLEIFRITAIKRESFYNIQIKCYTKKVNYINQTIFGKKLQKSENIWLVVFILRTLWHSEMPYDLWNPEV